MIDVRYTLEEKTICFSDYDNFDDLQADLAEISGIDLNGENADKYDEAFIRKLYIILDNEDEYEDEKYIDLCNFSTEDIYNFVMDCNAVFDIVSEVEEPILAWVSDEGYFPDKDTIEYKASDYFGEFSDPSEAALEFLSEVRNMDRDDIAYIESICPNFIDKVVDNEFYVYDDHYFYKNEW